MPEGTVVVWERDGLWEARLARELPGVRVRGARSAKDARERLTPPAALVIVAATAGPWLDAGPWEAPAVLVADGAEDAWWLAAGVAAVFGEAVSAGRVAAAVQGLLG